MSELPSRVAIIGAGFSGLSAAAVLERNSVDYTVFEGANRIGGRVYAISYEDGCLQHGAEFINGETTKFSG
uniref:Putative AMine oXidase n=1 Tax=Angiostrongylus cantonensis TaxID=6313 RepID=C7BVT1_ANGCA|nr:putative AMine oXidase [Angiostrongylus cantonensis]